MTMQRILPALLVPLAFMLSVGFVHTAPAADDTKKSKSAGQPAKPTKGQKAGARTSRGSAKPPASRGQSRSGATGSAPRSDAKAGGASPAAAAAPPERSAVPPATRVPLATPSGDFAVPIAPKRIANRMYAIDGDTFYHNGRKIRVQGIEGAAGSEMAKQRLQQLLDSGEVSIEPRLTDEAGRTEAVVRVNGRDVAEQLRAEGSEKPVR